MAAFCRVVGSLLGRARSRRVGQLWRPFLVLLDCPARQTSRRCSESRRKLVVRPAAAGRARGRHGGFGTASTRHATHTTRENTAERFLKRLISHSNSKLNLRNGARKVESTGTATRASHKPGASNLSRQSVRSSMMSTVSDGAQQECHDSVQDRSGTRRTSRTKPCGMRARRKLALAHVCKGGTTHPRIK